jgi:hypothetical protein
MSGQNRRASNQDSIFPRQNRVVASEKSRCYFEEFSLSDRGGDFSSRPLVFGSGSYVLRSRNVDPRREDVVCRSENVRARNENVVLRSENVAHDSEDGRFSEHRHGVREQTGRPRPRERRLSSRRCEFPLHEVEIGERRPEFLVAEARRCSRTRRFSSWGLPPAGRRRRFSFERRRRPGQTWHFWTRRPPRKAQGSRFRPIGVWFSMRRREREREKPVTCSGGFDAAAVPRT